MSGSDDPTTAPLKYGMPVYRVCDCCGQPIRIVPLVSGNTLGGTLWSDGYMDAPQMPEQPLLVRCRGCQEIVCLADLAPLIEESPPANAADQDFLPLALEDYQGLLANIDDISPKYQTYLRIKVWHMSNDRRRKGDADLPLSPEEHNNLRGLQEILGNGEAERLMKVEVLRELGEFEQASALLAGPFSERLDSIVSVLVKLVAARNSKVAVIFSGAPLT